MAGGLRPRLAMHFPRPRLLLALVVSPLHCIDLKPESPEEVASSPQPVENTEDPPKRPRLTDRQLRALHKLIDKDGNGKMSLDEFVAFDRETARTMLEKQAVDPNLTMTLEHRLSKFQGAADNETLQQRRMEEVKFRAADVDGDGLLVGPEVRALLHPQMHDAIVDAIVAQTLIARDKDDDGDLDIEEFWQKPSGELSEEEKAVFRQLDTEGFGELTDFQLKAWESGKFHANDMFKAFFKEADQDDDGELDVDELAVMLGQGPSFWEAEAAMLAWSQHHEM